MELFCNVEQAIRYYRWEDEYDYNVMKSSFWLLSKNDLVHLYTVPIK